MSIRGIPSCSGLWLRKTCHCASSFCCCSAVRCVLLYVFLQWCLFPFVMNPSIFALHDLQLLYAFSSTQRGTKAQQPGNDVE